MTYTCSELLRDGYQRVKFWSFGTATGGTTATIVDSGRTGVDAASYKNGLALIVKSTDAAAPQYEFSKITSYASNTFNLSPNLSTAVDAGDRYAVATNAFEYEEVFELINQALSAYDIPVVDSSLTTAEDQTEYTLPIAIKSKDEIYKVEYQGNTGDSNDNQPIAVSYWDIRFSSTGAAETLIIPQLVSGRTIYITYKGRHARVYDFDDEISEYIHPKLAQAAFVEQIRNREVEETLSAGDPQRRSYNKARQELAEAEARYFVRGARRSVKLLDL